MGEVVKEVNEILAIERAALESRFAGVSPQRAIELLADLAAILAATIARAHFVELLDLSLPLVRTEARTASGKVSKTLPPTFTYECSRGHHFTRTATRSCSMGRRSVEWLPSLGHIPCPTCTRLAGE